MKLLKTMAAGLGLLAAASLVPAASPAAAQQSRTFDLQHGFPINLPSLGPSPGRWAQMVDAMTNGEIKIRVRNAGELSPPLEMFGAVSSGAIPMAFDWMGYWANQIPVTNLVSAMPFGASPEILLAWMCSAAAASRSSRRPMTRTTWSSCPATSWISEAGGWFRKEINSVDDLKGLRMRIAGLGALVLSKLGVSTQLVPAGEIFVALERGRIDATEFSLPSIDRGLGFYRVAKNYYFPGWAPARDLGLDHHQQGRVELVHRPAAHHHARGLHGERDLQHVRPDRHPAHRPRILPHPGRHHPALPRHRPHRPAEGLGGGAERAGGARPAVQGGSHHLRDYIAKVGEWRELQRIPAPQR